MREQVMDRHRNDSGMRSQAKTCSDGSSPRAATRSLKLCESHPLPAPTSRTRARDHSTCPSSSSTRRLVAGLDHGEGLATSTYIPFVGSLDTPRGLPLL